MNNKRKTKEELIKELEELQQKLDSFDASCDKVAAGRTQAEKTLYKFEQKYRTLFENVQDVFFQADLAGIILEISPSIKHYSGFNREELIGTPTADLYYNLDDRITLLAAIMKTGELRDFEFRLKTKTGSIVYVSLNGRLIYDAEGKPHHIDGALRDITERKQAEETLRNNEARLHAIMQAIPDLMWLKDPDGVYLSCNTMFERLFGAKEGDIVGKTDYDFVDKELADSFRENDRKVMDEGKPASNEEWVVFADDGHRALLNTIKTPIYDSKGTLAGVLGVGHDITERQRMEAELVGAKVQAEESDRLKSAFLANMSHEIRTPMNGILGFTELLKDPDLTGEEQKTFIGIIEKSGERLLNIINDIVSISKVESGQMEVYPSQTNVNEQLEFIYTFFKPEVEHKGLKFILKNKVPEKEAVVKTDREKVYAILTNLVNNAVKFTEQGFIEIGCEKKGAFLEFFVRDTGKGIRVEMKEIIFQRFVQGEGSLNRIYEGAGLGLSISKAYVEMLGGKIWVESEAGKGSAFYFTIPCDEELQVVNLSTSVDVRDDEVVEIHDLKILIVDDDETSVLLITKALKKMIKAPLLANTGVEAVDACRKNPGIDLVMMDIRMPVMDGYEATTQIRKFNKDVIIIAQTAYAMPGDKEKALEAGCNDYTTKPIDILALKRLIQKHFKK